MAQILLIEDQPSSLMSLIADLEREGYEVIRAYSYNSAIGLWREYNGYFDCIVLDLNIDPDGLNADQIDEYSPVHGILVLDKICKGKMQGKSKDPQKIWDKTIIHSGYTKELKKFTKYESLKKIPKGGTSISEVFAKVKEIIINNVDNG